MGRFVFGPVPSRRLGFSLGVDIIPRKYCNFDCIYCQVGKTTNKELTRKSFFEVQAVVDEIVEEAGRAERVDFVTFSGSGEPTLNADLGSMIDRVKKRIKTPVAVITNGSLLWIEAVRNDLLKADVVLPSLDAASEAVFRYINRPHSLTSLSTIVEGLRSFRQVYTGLIWLEVMLIRGVNDDPEELERLRAVIRELHVDRIHLNTVTRPPAEETAMTMEKGDLERICAFFGPPCEVISTFDKAAIQGEREGWGEMILGVLKRRSLTVLDIVKITGIKGFEVEKTLKIMEAEGKVQQYRVGSDVYYRPEPPQS